MIAWAKMIGITPAALIFNGMYWRTPPYCLLPTILLAYCTGTLRVPCTSRIDPQNTRNNMINSIKNATKPPPCWETLEVNSAKKANGKRAMIPIIMMMDTPLPIPLSVILSPNHRTNIEPAAMITMEGSWNCQKPVDTKASAGTWAFKFVRYAEPCNTRITNVRYRVIWLILRLPLSPSFCKRWK